MHFDESIDSFGDWPGDANPYGVNPYGRNPYLGGPSGVQGAEGAFWRSLARSTPWGAARDLREFDQPVSKMSRPVVHWPDQLQPVAIFRDEDIRVVLPTPYGHGNASCSCGRQGCVHVVVAFRAVMNGEYDRDWRPALQRVLAAAGPERQTSPLALLLTIEPPNALDDPAGWVELRPGLKTKKGAWNKQITWRDVPNGYRGRVFDPTHLAALRAFISFGAGYLDASLSSIGSHFWSVLEGAVDAGVAIGSEGPRGRNRAITVDPTSIARLEPRLDRDDHLRLDAELIVPWDELRAYSLLGSPPHSLLARVGRGLQLVPVISDPVASEIRRTGPVDIPATDAGEFAREFLPKLRERSSITIGGDSTVPVTLVATYTGRGADGGHLAWAWDHGGTRFAVNGDSLTAGRNSEGEETLRRRLRGENEELWSWVDEPRELDPVQSCEFGLTAVPLLEQDPQTAVEIVGDAVEYAPAEDTQIVWDVEDTNDTDWFDLAVELVVDGMPVPMARLISCLATDQTLLILDDGTFVDLTTDEMVALRDLLREAAAIQVDRKVRVARHRIDLWERLQELGQARAQGKRWRDAVGALVIPDHTELPVPSTVRAELRDYQLDGFRWIATRWGAGLGGILADDMGLGKTLQVLTAIAQAKEQGGGPVLITAPRSVLRTWQDQAAQFVPSLKVTVITSKLRGSLLVDEAEVVVTSHQLVRLDAEKYEAIDWAALVVDEAQVVKNPLTQLHRALREIPRSFTLMVTGTPMENSTRDIWSLLELAAPGALPPLKEFNETIRRPIERGRDPEVLSGFRRRLRPLLLRRTKDQVAEELPPKMEQVVQIELSREHRTRYRQNLDHERQLVMGLLDDAGNNRVEILASLGRLRKLAAEVGEADRPTAKIDYLLDQLGEVRREGHRALVFGQFTSHLKVLQQQLTAAGVSWEYLDGGTTRRDRVIDSFKEGQADVFLISLKAGGVGLTLIEADYVFLLDPWWNPAVENQAIDRTHRIGQDKPVNVYRLVSADTIEEKVVSLQANKLALADALLAGGDGGAVLDPEEIRRLLED